MEILTSDFNEAGNIPKKFGYKYENINPRLEITNIPTTTKSIALIMDDPDAMGAVGKVWVHWLACNIKSNLNFALKGKLIIESGYSKGKLHEENSAILGKTDFGEIGYGGPAPPDKTHTYIIKVYALDKILNLKEGYSKTELENAMSEHIITEAKLTGTFSP